MASENFSEDDAKEYLNFQDILQIFNCPINEEQAWALCYQVTKYMLNLPTKIFYKILDFTQILLHKNGNISIKFDSEMMEPCATEKEFIFSLGIILYKALDYGLTEDEEVRLCPKLQSLITFMTEDNKETCHGKTPPPGCSRDSRLVEGGQECLDDVSIDSKINDQVSYTQSEHKNTEKIFDEIKMMCQRHLNVDNDAEADNQYANIIQALVIDGLQLLHCIKEEYYCEEAVEEENLDSRKIRRPDSSLNLNLSFDNSEKLWRHVINEINYKKILKSYQDDLKLTPREVLMDDIRKQRYRLRKTSGPITSIKKDTYSIILEFVRSRPQLRKVSDRELPPIRKDCNLHELLMENIKKPPKPLRSARSKQMTWLNQDKNCQMDGCNIADCQKIRKLIPVDFDFKLDDDEECVEDDINFQYQTNDESVNLVTNYRSARRASINCSHITNNEAINKWTIGGEFKLTKDEYHWLCDTQLESYDLATQCPSRKTSVQNHANRCILPYLLTDNTCIAKSRYQKKCENFTDSLFSTLESNFKRSHKFHLKFPNHEKPVPRPRNTICTDASHSSNSDVNDKCTRSTAGDILLEDRLSLTLEEIVHIRSVLTKAELESLPVEGRVKEDVEKRRVCFLCLKTRFGLLGPWGQRCRLCERTVCIKCYSKMKIPADHFSHIPVVLLSPSLLPSQKDLESDTVKTTWFKNRSTIGSAPTSPATKRTNRKNFGSPSKLYNTTTFGTFNRKTANQDRDTEHRCQEISMIICHDCRMMVNQIIKSTRLTRANIRNNVISRLTLNLSPVYV